jgi:hypothetical protein
MDRSRSAAPAAAALIDFGDEDKQPMHVLVDIRCCPISVLVWFLKRSKLAQLLACVDV